MITCSIQQKSSLIPNLDKTTINYIKALPDFDTQTKMAAIHKYKNIVLRIGYDPALKDPENLNKKYHTVRKNVIANYSEI